MTTKTPLKYKYKVYKNNIFRCINENQLSRFLDNNWKICAEVIDINVVKFLGETYGK